MFTAVITVFEDHTEKYALWGARRAY